MNSPAVDHRTKMLRRRVLIHRSIAILILAIAVLSCFDHFGAFGYSGNDWARFDKKSFVVRDVLAADVVRINGTDVQLLGVFAPHTGEHFFDESFNYAKGRLNGQTVTLRLEPTQTRDANGRLVAYVYSGDRDLINIDMIRDGRAYADRRTRHTFQSQFEMMENEARKKERGLWKDLKFNEMPEWRQAWLKSLRKK